MRTPWRWFKCGRIRPSQAFPFGANRTIWRWTYADIRAAKAAPKPDRKRSTPANQQPRACKRFRKMPLSPAFFKHLKRCRKCMAVMRHPGVQNFVGTMVQPLFEKIDTVHYTQMSRLLKIAEEYASRLLRSKYGYKKATEIARHFVHECEILSGNVRERKRHRIPRSDNAKSGHPR